MNQKQISKLVYVHESLKSESTIAEGTEEERNHNTAPGSFGIQYFKLSEIMTEENRDLEIGTPGFDSQENVAFAIAWWMYGEYDFYAIKGILEWLFEAVGIYGCEFKACGDNPTYHGGRCARIYKKDKTFKAQIHFKPPPYEKNMIKISKKSLQRAAAVI